MSKPHSGQTIDQCSWGNIMTFDFNPNDTVPEIKYVYHGTRIPKESILKEGLLFPGIQPLIQMISRSFNEVGMSFKTWEEYQNKQKHKGRFTTIGELSREHRRVIWVTDNENNAWSYAYRSPEIVTEAIRNEYIRLHYRRKQIIEETEKIVTDATAWIGNPRVVVIDAKKIGARMGCNQPIATHIPHDAIVEIKSFSK